MGLNVSDYARHRGVSHVAVLKALKSGRIAKEPDGSIDPVKADAAWARNSDPAQRRTAKAKPARTAAPKRAAPAAPAEDRAEPGPSAAAPALAGPSYAQSRAVREAYAARLAKLDYEERAGTLVRTDRVKLGWFNILRVLRDRLLNLPDRLAPILAAETEPRMVREALMAELRAVLADVADAVDGLKGQGADAAG